MTRRIGIDFGTANTVVAEWDEESATGIPLDLGAISTFREGAEGIEERVVPSLIAYRIQDSGTDRLYGAQVPRTREPGLHVFRNTKSKVSGKVVDAGSIVDGVTLTGRQAATEFLTTVMQSALLAADDSDVEFIVTAPVESFDKYSEWLVEVVDSIGEARIRITDEATAAAVGYSSRMRPGDTFMVIDAGAGTLDVSIVMIEEPSQRNQTGSVRAISKAGIDLGGTHIDALVSEHVLEALRIPLGNEDIVAAIRGQLATSSELAKIHLTSHESAEISATHPTSGEVYNYTISRAEFESVLQNKSVLSRISQVLNKAVEDAAARGFPSAGLKNVFLVGGTSLIPAIVQLVKYRFDPSIVRSDRPLSAVAIGAAAQAGGVELFDHIQHDYAIRHVDDRTGDYRFTTLVRAGTEYPTESPIASFSIQGIRDGQQHLGLAIFEMAHAVYREASSELELVFDSSGGARTQSVTPQKKLERSQVWLNEGNPTFLEADPPAKAGVERFKLDFRIDAQKRLTVSAFDVEARRWVLDRHPVVRLS